jgi:hypothetical protein
MIYSEIEKKLICFFNLFLHQQSSTHHIRNGKQAEQEREQYRQRDLRIYGELCEGAK